MAWRRGSRLQRRFRGEARLGRIRGVEFATTAEVLGAGTIAGGHEVLGVGARLPGFDVAERCWPSASTPRCCSWLAGFNLSSGSSTGWSSAGCSFRGAMRLAGLPRAEHGRRRSGRGRTSWEERRRLVARWGTPAGPSSPFGGLATWGGVGRRVSPLGGLDVAAWPSSAAPVSGPGWHRVVAAAECPTTVGIGGRVC